MNWSLFKPLRRRRLVVYPIIFFVLLIAAHLAGFREHLQVLSGACGFVPWSMFQGAAYLILYFLCLIASPIMLLAAALSAMARMVIRRSSR